MITNEKYLYLGGPLDGQWRQSASHDPATNLPRIEQVHYDAPDGHVYHPTKIGHIGPGGGFRMQLVIMLEQSLHSLILLGRDDVDDETHNRARQMDRAITMRAVREHLQLTWPPHAAGLLDFGLAWLEMEQRP